MQLLLVCYVVISVIGDRIYAFLDTTNLHFVHREHLNRRIGASAPQIKFMLTDLAEKKTQTLMDNLQHELETMVDDEPTDGEQISSQLLFDRFASIMK